MENLDTDNWEPGPREVLQYPYVSILNTGFHHDHRNWDSPISKLDQSLDRKF